jgi:hypothetical protein
MLNLLNILILQFLFIRLTRCSKTVIDKIDDIEFSLGDVSGYNSDFSYLGKARFIRVSPIFKNPSTTQK